MSSNIPSHELETLALAVYEAEMLARHGDVRDGYLCLKTGLACAEAARELGEPWAEALVERWERALAAFVRRHGTPAFVSAASPPEGEEPDDEADEGPDAAEGSLPSGARV